MPCVIIEGKELRFCRPCGRLHMMGEFDGTFASCRAKLQKAAERRRKAAGLDAGSSGKATSGKSSEEVGECKDARGNERFVCKQVGQLTLRDGVHPTQTGPTAASTPAGTAGGSRSSPEFEWPGKSSSSDWAAQSDRRMKLELPGEEAPLPGPAFGADGGSLPRTARTAEALFQIEEGDQLLLDILMEELHEDALGSASGEVGWRTKSVGLAPARSSWRRLPLHTYWLPLCRAGPRWQRAAKQSLGLPRSRARRCPLLRAGVYPLLLPRRTTHCPLRQSR